MKAIDIFYCASQAATSTTTTMDYYDIHQQPSSSAFNAGRAIDRHNPIIQDQKRLARALPVPPPSSSPATGTPDHNNNKNKKKKPKKNPKQRNNDDQKRKSCTINGFADADENKDEQLMTNNKNNYVVRKSVLLGWPGGCTRPGDFISPATSSRFLLSSDKPFMSDDHQFHDPLLKQVSHPPPPPPPRPAAAEKTYKTVNDANALKSSAPAGKTYKSFNDINALKNAAPADKTYAPDSDKALKKEEDDNLPSSPVKTQPPSLSSRQPSDQQMVVLRVSLHCKGCERKMRKHISKMEGVTSFNIDFMAKKVTVVGDITPLAVLTSVSKVKNAKLLTPTTISSPTLPQPDSQVKFL